MNCESSGPGANVSIPPSSPRSRPDVFAGGGRLLYLEFVYKHATRFVFFR